MGKVFPRDWKYVPQDVRPFNIYNIEEGIYKPGMFNKKWSYLFLFQNILMIYQYTN